MNGERDKPEEVKKQSRFRDFYMTLFVFYEKKYKLLLIIPAVMLLLSFLVIGVTYVKTGDFIHRGESLKGGITVTIPTEKSIDIKGLEKSLSSEFPNVDISVRALASAGKQTAISVSATDMDEKALVNAIKNKLGAMGDYAVETTGSSLGKSFFRETFYALIVAFVLMAIVVFIYFRIPIPCLAVIFSAFSDIVVTVAVIDLLGVKLSTAGIAALLMLIGYSIDTDILLSSRVLKGKEGTVFQRSLSSVKTGLTMLVATTVAVTVAYFLSESGVIKQIMLIIFIGLLVDVINTWIMNTGILRWYLEEHVPYREKRA